MRKNETAEYNSVVDRIEGKLLEHNTHFLNGEIDEENVGAVIKWITYENFDRRQRTITLFINSAGGDLYQAFALIDVMKSSQLPIRTIGIGQVMSAAFLIFVSGAKGERVIARNTGIMCHQYSDAPEGKHHDLKAHMVEGEMCNRRMLDILREATDLPVTKIKSKLLRETDVYLTAEEAIDLGVADSIL